MKKSKLFFWGFKEMIPITTGVIPFGAIVGTVCANAELSFFQAMSLNFLVYAGAAKLATVDLMTQQAASIVVIITGLIINLRFLLYSAALAPVLKDSRLVTKIFCAYNLTDQSYAVTSANESKLKNNAEVIVFYLGAISCMSLAWHLSVICGYIFGNFAPASWSLDYAIPLSFVALVMPTLRKNIKYIYVAAFSSVVAILLNSMPYKTGLIVTALLGITLAAFLTRKAHD